MNGRAVTSEKWCLNHEPKQLSNDVAQSPLNGQRRRGELLSKQKRLPFEPKDRITDRKRFCVYQHAKRQRKVYRTVDSVGKRRSSIHVSIRCCRVQEKRRGLPIRLLSLFGFFVWLPPNTLFLWPAQKASPNTAREENPASSYKLTQAFGQLTLRWLGPFHLCWSAAAAFGTKAKPHSASWSLYRHDTQLCRHLLSGPTFCRTRRARKGSSHAARKQNGRPAGPKRVLVRAALHGSVRGERTCVCSSVSHSRRSSAHRVDAWRAHETRQSPLSKHAKRARSDTGAFVSFWCVSVSQSLCVRG